MKKRILLFTAIAGIAYFTFSSNKSGVAQSNSFDCTGAETGLGNPTGCAAPGNSCHSTTASTSITVSLALDSNGVAQTYYTPGATYTIKIKGVNTGSTSLPNFGFQVGVITGTTAVATPTNAGTMASTGLPLNVRYEPAQSGSYVVNLEEQKNLLAPATGTGGTGTTYVDSFSWTAPAAGTGSISIWGVLNAVNANTNADAGDLWNTSKAIITEGRASLSVGSVTSNLEVKAFPNPVANNLSLKLNNAQAGAYTVTVYDLNGSSIATEHLEVSAASQMATINSGSWAPGMYQVVVAGNGSRQVISVVKK